MCSSNRDIAASRLDNNSVMLEVIGLRLVLWATACGVALAIKISVRRVEIFIGIRKQLLLSTTLLCRTGSLVGST